MTQKRALVLVSGGLDSATVLAMAKQQGFECVALSFEYGQRHSSELDAAHRLVSHMQISDHKIATIDLTAIGGSALTDLEVAVPDANSKRESAIPVTYVPARNTIFLSYALAWAEVLKINDIFIGVNAVDYSGYPDCRPEYITSFEHMANLATKSAVEGQKISIHTPLIKLSKSEIVAQGTKLGVDYSLTVSCYQADAEGRACGRCESCMLRKQGFENAGLKDPTRYQ